ncbi:hypothetical protein BPAE_0295g00120 [Botrytis paeoniae]|uniref:Uncharacterized protein n=1 Tax=Botrytis paeoniae TaxID=278948 RepID=A0A4Z1FAW6_9HELO|nr:hypothetical protein BPAE_0295g00120 [Botrytis paeoniae]
MASTNPKYLGVIIKASAKASPAVTLWCIAGAWGELVKEAIQNINSFDKTKRAQVRAQIKRGDQGEVVWMVIDPNNLAHRRAIAYAFSQDQDMALMAFYNSKRAVNMLSRNEEIPSTMHGLGADSGTVTRNMNREQNSDLYANFGRFVLRQTAELTNADIAALSSGVSNLVMLAHREAGLNREKFLTSVFFNWDTSYVPPGGPPTLPDKIVSDASIACGFWRTDCYSQSERSQAKAANKLPSEMGFPERPAFQKAGAEVLIKARPGIVAPTLGFVNRNHQFEQEDNIAFSCSANAIMLIWLVRRRLYHWHSLQEAIAWDQSVEYIVLEDETVFQPRRPFQSYFQMFGSAMGEGTVMGNATAGDTYYPRWLGG